MRPICGDVECAVGEVFSAQRIGCSSDGLHLGMGGNIVQSLGEIVCTADDFSATNHHCPDRNFAGFGSLLGFEERFLHKRLVDFLLRFVHHLFQFDAPFQAIQGHRGRRIAGTFNHDVAIVRISE